MSWRVHVLKNTLRVDVAALDELRSADDVVVDLDLDTYDDGDGDEAVEDGRTTLYFDEDHMEHIDWLWRDGVPDILIRHNAEGEVLFGQLEGDGGPKFWGYRFDKTGIRQLSGKISWRLL
jgi:hypothetical protein